MSFKKLYLGLTFFILTLQLSAQEVWSLQKCIQYAQQNSLTVQQANNQVQQSQLSLEEQKNERYPTLNSNFSGGVNFGRTIDPSTNTFTSQTILNSSVGVNAAITLYNGGRIKNQIRQSKINVEAAKADNEQIKNDLALNVAAAYLQILLDKEQLAIVNSRLAQSEAQLEQTDRLIKVGTLPRADRLEIIATIARNEQVIISQENALEASYLNLKNLLQINPAEEIRVEPIEKIEIEKDANPASLSLTEVYNQAINLQPFIQRDKFRLMSAEIDQDIAQSLALPTVFLSGNLNSYYSNKTPDFQNIISPGEFVISSPQTVVIDGEEKQLQNYQLVGTEFGKRSYFDQLNDNFGQSLSLNINIPIYNRNRTGIAKQRAKLNLMNTEINALQNKQQLKVDIQRALASAKANKKTYEAASKTFDALTAAYANTEKRFQLGTINTFEYTTAKNNLDQAAIDEVIAKYNYLYSLKVLDFYRGERLSLE